MKILNLNHDYRYDVDMSEAQIQFNEDDTITTERISVRNWNMVISSRLEFKHDAGSIRTGNIYVEYEIEYKSNGDKKPSGLATTKSDYMLFDFEFSTLIINTFMLKHILNKKEYYIDKYGVTIRDTQNEKNRAEKNITHGLVIPLSSYFQIEFDYHSEQRIQNARKNIGKSLK